MRVGFSSLSLHLHSPWMVVMIVGWFAKEFVPPSPANHRQSIWIPIVVVECTAKEETWKSVHRIFFDVRYTINEKNEGM